MTSAPRTIDSAYHALRGEFVRTVGYAGQCEIPDELLVRLADFIKQYAHDIVATYYATSLLDQFFRRRSEGRSARLFHALVSQIDSRMPIIPVLRRKLNVAHTRSLNGRGIFEDIWPTIRHLTNGYAKANYIGHYAPLFKGEHAMTVYEDARAMAEPYKTRALAGLYAEMTESIKSEILSHLCNAFVEGPSEATFGIARIFPFLDRRPQAAVVSLYLDLPHTREEPVFSFVLGNAPHLHPEDAHRLAERIRAFGCEYRRNRCLLKLPACLREGELRDLHQRFIRRFHEDPPSTELLHNLYQFSDFIDELDERTVVALALDKIADFDDASCSLYDQQKVNNLLFLIPHLTAEDSEQAYAIAATIRGGFRRGVISKLRRHFLNAALHPAQ